MEAGATYFFSKYWLTQQDPESEASGNRAMPMDRDAPTEAQGAASGTPINLLVRVDSGKPQTQERDFGLRHVNVGMLPMMNTLQSIVQSGGGVGVIVSSQFNQKQLSFSQDWNPRQAWKAVKGAKDYFGVGDTQSPENGWGRPSRRNRQCVVRGGHRSSRGAGTGSWPRDVGHPSAAGCRLARRNWQYRVVCSDRG